MAARSQKLPFGYVCRICKKPGHWMHECRYGGAKAPSSAAAAANNPKSARHLAGQLKKYIVAHGNAKLASETGHDFPKSQHGFDGMKDWIASHACQKLGLFWDASGGPGKELIRVRASDPKSRPGRYNDGGTKAAYSSSAAAAPAKRPPPTYVCRICKKPGHWIDECRHGGTQAAYVQRKKLEAENQKLKQEMTTAKAAAEMATAKAAAEMATAKAAAEKARVEQLAAATAAEKARIERMVQLQVQAQQQMTFLQAQAKQQQTQAQADRKAAAQVQAQLQADRKAAAQVQAKLQAQLQADRKAAAAQLAKQLKLAQDAGGIPVWECKSDSGWKTYPAQVGSAIELAHSSGQARHQLTDKLGATSCAYTYDIDIQNMVQRNTSTGKTRTIRRRVERVGAGAAGAAASRLPWRSTGTSLHNSIKCYHITSASVAGGEVTREQQEYNQAYAQFVRLTSSNKTVVAIDVYVNPTVQRVYDQTKRSFASHGKPSSEVVVFHGTAQQNIVPIMTTGFKVGGAGVAVANGTAYGRGVYSAVGPNTPMGYASTNSVILAMALPGSPDGSRNGSAGGDSWRPKGDWIIFRSGSQLLPKWVVHFK
jgi:hypothetical protein